MPEPISGADAVQADATVVTTPDGGTPANGAAPDGKPAEPVIEPNKADDGDGEFVDDNAEPAINQRKTAKDYIIQRKMAKIAKLEKAKQGGEGEPKDGDDAGDDPADEPLDDEPGDVTPSLEGLKPIVEEHVAAKDAKEVDEFLSKNPQFAPYKAKVERWMKHPSRRNLPVSTIFAEAIGIDGLMKIGANLAREADVKAKESQAGGGSNRDATSPIDWRTATKEQLEAEQMRVRLGK